MEQHRDIDLAEKDLLLGGKAIANYLGVAARQVYRLCETGLIPHFRLGNAVASRKSSLRRWLDDIEASGVEQAKSLYDRAQGAKEIQRAYDSNAGKRALERALAVLKTL